MKKSRLISLAMTCVAGAMAIGACTTAPTRPGLPEPAIPVVDLTASDFTFEMPKQVSAGLVTLNFVNHGKDFHHAVIMKLTKPDVAMNQVMEALQKTDQQPDFIDPTKGGYVAVLSPAGGVQMTTRYEPGRYVVLCFVAGEDGMPHAMKGMTGMFDVVEGNITQQPPEPKADLVVTLKKDGVDFPAEMKAGKQTWKVVNETGNPDANGVEVAMLLAGKTRADLEVCTRGGCTPAKAPGTALGGGAGMTGPTWLTFDLKPGDNYWLQTNVPDPNAAAPSHDQPPKSIWLQFAVK